MSYGYVSWTIEHRLNEKIEIYLILGKQATEMISYFINCSQCFVVC